MSFTNSFTTNTFSAILTKSLQHILSGKTCVICTPVRIIGSVPCPSNARLVAYDTHLEGTIGGGSLEHQAGSIASNLLSSSDTNPLLFRFDYDSLVALKSDPICGGNVTVLIEKITPEVAQEWLNALSSDSGYLEVLNFSSPVKELLKSTGVSNVNLSRHFLVDPQQIPSSLSQLDILPSLFQSNSFSEVISDDVLVLIRRPLKVITVFGAGHCSRALSQIAPLAGFKVELCDDRDELVDGLTPSPDVIGIKVDYNSVQSLLQLRPQSFIVIMTHGHSHDLTVLRQVLSSSIKFPYIGMIGSKRKVKLVLDQLKSEGISEELISSVYAPIGLPIGGGTAGCVAISIAAQIVQVSSGGKKKGGCLG
ncbi:hypothetical protein RCL1_008759 [Eukaryota sp. TZLM3-RCL]